MTTQHLIYTVGYEGLTVPELARWSQATDAVVLDTRWKPWSRRGEWNLPNLYANLPAFLWLKTLGNLNYNVRGAPIELADPERGVRIASRILDRAPICLLCYEAEHWHCHRAEAAELIASATGATIQPLTAADVRGVAQLALSLGGR